MIDGRGARTGFLAHPLYINTYIPGNSVSETFFYFEKDHEYTIIA
jgi:hypothetical protein